MELALGILGVLLNLWIIFLGGAEKIKDTLVGYFEFGVFADNSSYIRVLAWFGLVASAIAMFT